MILRRDRVHQSGTSNLTGRISRRASQEASSQADSTMNGSLNSSQIKSCRTTSVKTRTSVDTIQEKTTRIAPLPIVLTQQFYEQEGKSPIKKVLIGNPRLAHLEEVEKGRPVFVGDSSINQVKSRAKSQDSQSQKEIKSKTDTRREESSIASNILNARTLKANVDIEKIQEAKRAIRKKYLNKKDLNKIYQTWNENTQGEISVDNIYHLTQKLGLNLNYDEARVLVATANKNNSDTLGHTGFLNLLQGKNDTSTIDFNALAANLGNDYLTKREQAEKELGSELNKDSQKQFKEIKRANQAQLVLKNRLRDLKKAFEENDTNQTGVLNLENFQEAIKKLRISDTVICDQDIQDIYEKSKGENSKIEISSFLDNLKNFSIDYKSIIFENQPKNKIERSSVKAPKVVDLRDLSFNQIENIHTKSKNVGKVIQKLFPTKKDFTHYFENIMNLSKDEIENLHLSRPQFKDMVDNLFNKFDVKYLNPSDFEGLLTSVLYNKKGYTNFNEITNTIYDEDIHKFTEKVQSKRHGPAPHDASHSLRSKSEERVDSNSIFQETRQASLPPLRESGPRGFNKKSQFKNLLSNLDAKVFLGKKSALEAFREFDLDNDGYVSHKDIIEKIERKNLLQSEDIPRLLEYIDPENKGYVDFSDFSKKIRPNMANTNEDGSTSEKTALGFNKPDFDQEKMSVAWVRKIIEKTKKSFEASPNIENLKRVTRRGSNPPWKNTFLNFQPDSNTSMFVTEKERLNKHHLASTSFQLEEKERQKVVHEKKLENLRAKQDAFRAKLDHQASVLDQKDKDMLKLKYFRLTSYERTAKLRSGFN